MHRAQDYESSKCAFIRVEGSNIDSEGEPSFQFAPLPRQSSTILTSLQQSSSIQGGTRSCEESNHRRGGRKLHRGFFLLKRLLRKFLVDFDEQQSQGDHLGLLGKVFTPGTIFVCLIFTFSYTLLCLQFCQLDLSSPEVTSAIRFSDEGGLAKTLADEMSLEQDFQYPVIGNLLSNQAAQFSSSQPPRRLLKSSDEWQLVAAKDDHELSGEAHDHLQSVEAGGIVLPYLEPESDLLEKLKRAPTANRKQQEYPTTTTETGSSIRPEI